MKPMGRGFLLQWVLASAVGAAVCAPLLRRVSMAVGGAGGESMGRVVAEAVTGALVLGGIMLGIAIAQWLIAGRKVSWGGRLAFAIAIGGALGGAATLGLWAALAGSDGQTAGVLVAVVGGLTVFGMAQWLVLRRHVSWAGRWAAASGVSLAAAWIGVGLLGALAGDAPEALFGFGFGAVYGAVTGSALMIFDKRAATTTGVA